MFQSLKNLFSKLGSKQAPETAAPPPAAPQPSRLSAPPEAKSKSKSAPPPAPAPAPAPAAASAPAPAPAPSGPPEETFALPVRIVLARLPAALAALVKSTGGGDMQLPLKKVLGQLPQGVVKISFGELRQASPPGTFLEVTSQDSTIIELPLPEIVSRINPSLISRRQDQKVVEVPVEVGNVFGPHGETTAPPPSAPAAAAPAPAAPKPAPAAPAPAAPVSSPALPKPAAPAPSSPALPKPPAPAVSSTSLPKPPAPVSSPSLPKPPAPSISSPSLPKPPAPPAPAAPKIPAPGLPSSPSLPKPAAPAPAPAAPVAASMPSAPTDQTQYFLQKEAVPASGSLTVQLSALTMNWPDAVKQEINQQGLKESTLELPMANVEAGLKSGKIIFTWKEIGGWLKPKPLSSSPIGDTVIELPLKVIAPLFIAQHKPAKPQKKLNLGENIPDIFAGGALAPKPAAAPAAPAAPAPAPVAPAPAPAAPIAMPAAPKPAVAPAPAPVPAAAKVPTTLGEVFGEPQKAEWTPKEICQKASAVKGLAGAVIATYDGLTVAGELPAPLKVDMVAAFLPQILLRMNQYSKELQAGGDVTTMTVNFDKVQWQVSKLGKVYFAAVGRPGEPLPIPQLNVICGELAKQNK